MNSIRDISAGLLVAAASTFAACGDEAGGDSSAAGSALPQGSEHVELDPARFTTEITNPFLPLERRSHWVYRETDAEGARQRVVVSVTGKTKRIANGIDAVVVRDTVRDARTRQPLEVTDDWFAQDDAGNVWYLGEDTAEYENGKPVSTEGSFEAGVDGAEPGIAMPANPQDGMTYRQEYYAGEAEDWAEVLSTEEMAEAKFGHFRNALLTKDLVPTEPKVQEYKLYAQGVGLVLTLDAAGGSGREELLSYEPGK